MDSDKDKDKDKDSAPIRRRPAPGHRGKALRHWQAARASR